MVVANGFLALSFQCLLPLDGSYENVVILCSLKFKIQKVGFAGGIKPIKTGYNSPYFQVISL